MDDHDKWHKNLANPRKNICPCQYKEHHQYNAYPTKPVFHSENEIDQDIL
jgi:hypothetical protein